MRFDSHLKELDFNTKIEWKTLHTLEKTRKSLFSERIQHTSEWAVNINFFSWLNKNHSDRCENSVTTELSSKTVDVKREPTNSEIRDDKKSLQAWS